MGPMDAHIAMMSRKQDQIAALESLLVEISTIAHQDGSGKGFSALLQNEQNLNDIRRLTLPYWEKVSKGDR